MTANISNTDRINNWGTISKPVSKWAQKHKNKMYTELFNHKTECKRAAGLPLAIASAGLSLIELTSFAAEPIITAGKGFQNILGAPFSKNCKVLPGIGQLMTSIFQAAVIAILIPYVICALAVSLVALPILIAIIPDRICKKFLDPRMATLETSMRVPLATIDDIMKSSTSQ